jgi:hypothetical protein
MHFVHEMTPTATCTTIASSDSDIFVLNFKIVELCSSCGMSFFPRGI